MDKKFYIYAEDGLPICWAEGTMEPMTLEFDSYTDAIKFLLGLAKTPFYEDFGQISIEEAVPSGPVLNASGMVPVMNGDDVTLADAVGVL
jgi:hypothetical protein